VTKGDLDGVQIWGRPIKPVALGLSLLMLTLAVVNITDTGVFEDMLLGDVVAVLAVGSFTALMVGWFARYQIAAEIGLFSASIVYLIRASFAAFTLGIQSETVYLSLGVAVVAGGSFLLERWDHIEFLKARQGQGVQGVSGKDRNDDH